MNKINYEKIVKNLSEISDKFNDWELEFICSCYNWSGEHTEAQKKIILKMNNKYRKCN